MADEITYEEEIVEEAEEESTEDPVERLRKIFGDTWVKRYQEGITKRQKLPEEAKKDILNEALERFQANPENPRFEWVDPITGKVYEVALVRTGLSTEPKETKIGNVYIVTFFMETEPYVLFFSGHDDPDLQMLQPETYYIAVVRPRGGTQGGGGTVAAVIPIEAGGE